MTTPLTLTALFDGALIVGATLRLIRLLIIDDLGYYAFTLPTYRTLVRLLPDTKRWVADGLTCPFCIGFWLGALTVVSYWLVNSHDTATLVWRLTAGALTLNWVAGHVFDRVDNRED